MQPPNSSNFPLQPRPEQMPCRAATDITPDRLLTPGQVALELDLSVKTLATWRSTGRHALAFIKCGGRIRYARADLDAWLADRQRTSTSAREVA